MFVFVGTSSGVDHIYGTMEAGDLSNSDFSLQSCRSLGVGGMYDSCFVVCFPAAALTLYAKYTEHDIDA